jgi:hypothetical protein
MPAKRKAPAKARKDADPGILEQGKSVDVAEDSGEEEVGQSDDDNVHDIGDGDYAGDHSSDEEGGEEDDDDEEEEGEEDEEEGEGDDEGEAEDGEEEEEDLENAARAARPRICGTPMRMVMMTTTRMIARTTPLRGTPGPSQGLLGCLAGLKVECSTMASVSTRIGTSRPRVTLRRMAP